MQQNDRRAYVEHLMDRLRRQYTEHRPIFWELYRLARDDGMEVSITHFPGQFDNGTLSPNQLKRLYRAITTEGYGL